MKDAIINLFTQQGSQGREPRLYPNAAPDVLVLAGNILAIVVRGILLFAGFYAIYYLIYSGILYITSGGEAEKATKGKLGLIYSIVGVIIIALSWILLTYLTQVAPRNLIEGIFTPGQTPVPTSPSTQTPAPATTTPAGPTPSEQTSGQTPPPSLPTDELPEVIPV